MQHPAPKHHTQTRGCNFVFLLKMQCIANIFRMVLILVQNFLNSFFFQGELSFFNICYCDRRFFVKFVVTSFTQKENMIRYRHMRIFELKKEIFQSYLVQVRSNLILIQNIFNNSRPFFNMSRLQNMLLSTIFTNTLMLCSFAFTKKYSLHCDILGPHIF